MHLLVILVLFVFYDLHYIMFFKPEKRSKTFSLLYFFHPTHTIITFFYSSEIFNYFFHDITTRILIFRIICRFFGYFTFSPYIFFLLFFCRVFSFKYTTFFLTKSGIFFKPNPVCTSIIFTQNSFLFFTVCNTCIGIFLNSNNNHFIIHTKKYFFISLCIFTKIFITLFISKTFLHLIILFFFIKNCFKLFMTNFKIY